MTSLLHLYSPIVHHGEAYIVGDRVGLTALRDAIDRALAEDSAAVEVFIADGEAYTAFVFLNEYPAEHKRWQWLALPYRDGFGAYQEADQQGELIPPSGLVSPLRLAQLYKAAEQSA